ncbi:MAG: hypothetical protein CMJ78_05935 [Planctomycetaceae bacterium]|nr:hypothetical protein [Planctomycetaceae bacterium]
MVSQVTETGLVVSQVTKPMAAKKLGFSSDQIDEWRSLRSPHTRSLRDLCSRLLRNAWRLELTPKAVKKLKTVVIGLIDTIGTTRTIGAVRV